MKTFCTSYWSSPSSSPFRSCAYRQNVQNVPPHKILFRYGGVIVVTLLIGYISARPALRCYYDATEMKENTLTQNSLDIMKKLDGPLTITTYVNMFDENYFRLFRVITMKI